MPDQISQIESFIKKYRSAIASNSKDIRISIEEATDIVSAFATVNTSNQDLTKVLTNILSEIKSLKNKDTSQAPMLDGGKFK